MTLAESFGSNGTGPVEARRLGQVVGGSLSRGLDVRLDGYGAGIEDVAVGSFVTIQGRRQRYFAVVTDVELRAVDDGVRHFPPASSPGAPDAGDFTAEVIAGTLAYGQLSVMPSMAVPIGDPSPGVAEQAKTIPEHFAPVYAASQADIDAVFRAGEGDFALGSPQGMESSLVRLDLAALANRSVGVFGASGTGKTFLARMLLAGLVKQTQSVSLVFDMESEYGWQGQDNDRGRQVKGLKQLFPSRVVTFTLDEESSRRRGVTPDGVVRIGYNEVEPEDIEVLRESLNLSEVAAATSWNVARHYRENWLREFMALSAADVGDLATEIGVNLSALQTLHRRLLSWERFGFLADVGRGSASAGGIIEQLERGNHVVLEFGQYGRNTAAYVLVSNLLTRRIHETWVRRKESADGGHGDEPRPLVIFVEEAHKFLTPDIASQTIFGAIARQLRKYNVTLMIVDQRPSGIDSEVMSQLGTRLSCALNDDRDMNAVLMGARDAGQLRNVLSRLDSKQQALVFGHAVPMPVVVRPRDYDEGFYADMGTVSGVAVAGVMGETDAERMQREIDELFPPE